MMFAKRFWSKVSPGEPEDCRPWTSARRPKGYGQFYLMGRAEQAHRVAWALANGRPVPPGLHVLHRCDNPPCCNPAHLFVGTNAQNNADMMAKGRQVVLRGTDNGATRLSEGDVREIRALVASGISQESVARRFGVSRTHIGDICHRRRWRHIA